MAAIGPSSPVGLTDSTVKQPPLTDVADSSSDTADPAAPSKDVTSTRQRLSDIFTIFCAGFALISDGYQNNLMFALSIRIADQCTL